MSVRAGAPASRWAVAAVAVALAANIGVAGGVVVHRTVAGLRPTAAPGGSLTEARPAVGEDEKAIARDVEALLSRRALAVRHRDVRAFLTTVDPLGSPAFRASQRASASALRVVPLSSWAYELDPDHVHTLPSARLPRYGGAPTWSPEVLLRYRIAGFDTEPTQDQLYPTFVQRSGHWYLGADDDFTADGLSSQKGPWDFGPIYITRSRASIVLSHTSSSALPRLVASEVDAAVARVDAVWRRPWAQRAVVILPATEKELETLIGETHLEQIAAVATAEATQLADGSRQDPVGDRVLVNPPNFRKLGPLGRRVVLTHELTHVATRTLTGDRMPSWLVEGFADYVGYLGAGVPVTVAASELGDDLRHGTPLRGLPTDKQFAATNPRLAQAYEGAWLANRLIADRIGSAGLAALYSAVGRAATRGANPDTVLSRVLQHSLGLTLAQFTAAWRGYVRKELG